MKLNTLINSNKVEFDIFYRKLLSKQLNNSILAKAMKYGSMNGGKRIRPFLVREACKIVKINKKIMLILAASVIAIEASSLALCIAIYAKMKNNNISSSTSETDNIKRVIVFVIRNHQ